jgi:hypothetical protein
VGHRGSRPRRRIPVGARSVHRRASIRARDSSQSSDAAAPQCPCNRALPAGATTAAGMAAAAAGEPADRRCAHSGLRSRTGNSATRGARNAASAASRSSGEARATRTTAVGRDTPRTTRPRAGTWPSDVRRATVPRCG